MFRLYASVIDSYNPAISATAIVVLLGMAIAAGFALGFLYHRRRLANVLAEVRDRVKESEDYRYSVLLSPQIAWITDENGVAENIGPQWGEILGAPIQETFGDAWKRYAHPDDLPRTIDSWGAMMAKGARARIDTRCRLRCADGSYRWFRARGKPRCDEHGKVLKWYGTIEDINDQVEAERALRGSEERYRLASRATNDIIWDWTAGDNRVGWSEGVETVLGYPEAKQGTPVEWWLDRLHPDDRPRMSTRLQRFLEGESDYWSDEYRFRVGGGEYLDILARGYGVRDDAGKVVRMVGAMMDITARKRGEEELRWAASHDALTHLPNRTLFAERLEAALEDADRSNGSVGLVVIDVDRFKTLNDTQGHLAGDALLREIAERLTRQVPSDGTVARLGGDEFAVVIPSPDPHDGGREMHRRIFERMTTPFVYDGRHIEITVSAGGARFPRDGSDAESLLKSADLALYAAKAAGLGQVRGFQPAMRDAVEREKTMLFESREALSDDRIVPFYQPKISLRSGRIIGFEALLRWHHHRRGLRPPGEMSAAFEDGQLAVQLTDRMLDRTIADMALWLDRGCEFERIALNSSTEDFRRGDFADRILGRLAQAGIPPSRLELEVTETVFLGKQSEDVERTLRTLRGAGITIALDDFGTGYASLTHLKQFPVDTIKIDRSFVSRLISSEQEDAIIVGALIDLAKNLRIATVAEGVETELQAHLLRARGCDAAQGFLFERALPASRVPAFVASWDGAETPAEPEDAGPARHSKGR